MNECISITYDKSEKDLTALTAFKFDKEKRTTEMIVGYVGNNAEELIKMVTKQGYINEHDKQVRADEREKVLDEVIETLVKSEDTILSDKQYYALMELKEQK